MIIKGVQSRLALNSVGDIPGSEIIAVKRQLKIKNTDDAGGPAPKRIKFDPLNLC
jgi:hypothetical protein